MIRSSMGILTTLVLAVAVAACAKTGPEPASAATEAAEGEAVTLALALEPGAVYEGRLVQTQDLPNGQQLVTTAHVRTYVADAQGGVFTLEDTYRDVAVKVGDEEVGADQMRELEGVRIRYQLDRRGQLVGEPEATGTTEANRALAQELAKSVSQSSVPFPDHPVAVGQSWEGTRAVETPTELASLSGEMREVHRLERIETDGGQRWAVISIRGKMTIDPVDRGSVHLEGTGTIEGEQRVLMADGFSNRTTSDATLRLEGKVGDPPRDVRGSQKTGTEIEIHRVDGGGEGS